MPYLNTSTSTFGHTVLDVRIANPNVSIPDGHSYGDFEWYEPTVPEFDPITHTAVEVAPLNGVQQWGVVALPVITPTACTRRQGLLALLQNGITRADVLALLAQIQDTVEREAAEIEYEAAVWELDNPVLRMAWVQLGKDIDDLPGVFALAVTL
jgi:hypothetical protein